MAGVEQSVRQGRDVPDSAAGGMCKIKAGTEDTALLLARRTAWRRASSRVQPGVTCPDAAYLAPADRMS
jgi:hypothetical protein